ncbi:hypothetical protein C5615_20175 [Burkholderia cepacia]|uniref:Uncharacterized protein n=1 Tax=Burkholderia cepacia TaxID=292 RepID=A0A2S8INH6_BURCE|nr:hypothetical protein C5615_20175 [Burkholderia cepacia]
MDAPPGPANGQSADGRCGAWAHGRMGAWAHGRMGAWALRHCPTFPAAWRLGIASRRRFAAAPSPATIQRTGVPRS